MVAIYNGLVQLHQNAQDAEDDAGNGGKTLWSMEGHCEKMDTPWRPKHGKRGPKEGCLSGIYLPLSLRTIESFGP